MDRRTVLAGFGAVTVGIAGCLDSDGSDEVPRPFRLEVTVQNNHDQPYDVGVVVTDGEEVVVFDTSFTLSPGEGRGLGDDFAAGEYTVAIEVGDRQRGRSFWNTDQCDVHRVQTTIESDGRLTDEVSCQAE